MKVVLTTETASAAVVLKNQIIAAVRGELDDVKIDTWSYIKSGDGFDVVYHNSDQYTDEPEKNVLFRVDVEGSEVIFSAGWWKNKPMPKKEMLCLHTGRLTEMLLRYFSAKYIKFNVVDF